MSRSRLAAFVAVLIVSVSLVHAQPASGQKSYVCRPCGCGRDEEVFHAPGTCPSCGMLLVEQGSLAGAVEGAGSAPVAPDESHDCTRTRQRKVTRLAEGVYAIRHPDAPDGFPQGNTTVVIGDRGVLVVDSCYLPSSAREDIAQIRQWTDRPVRYLLNTHWHYDHTIGNAAYAEAFPEITIVSHVATLREMRGYNAPWLARYPERTAELRRTLSTAKEDGEPLTEARKVEVATALKARESVGAEYLALVDRLPTMTFDSALAIDLGGREVELLHLGRGNTEGDAVVYLRREKILVTGDLLDHPVPYLGGGFPSDLIRTLERMAGMDVETFVPGHGEVVHGKAYLGRVTELVREVVERVDAEVHRIGNNSRKLDEVQTAVLSTIDVTAWRKAFAGDNPEDGTFFDDFSLLGLIRAAFAEAWRR